MQSTVVCSFDFCNGFSVSPVRKSLISLKFGIIEKDIQRKGSFIEFFFKKLKTRTLK